MLISYSKYFYIPSRNFKPPSPKTCESCAFPSPQANICKLQIKSYSW